MARPPWARGPQVRRGAVACGGLPHHGNTRLRRCSHGWRQRCAGDTSSTTRCCGLERRSFLGSPFSIRQWCGPSRGDCVATLSRGWHAVARSAICGPTGPAQGGQPSTTLDAALQRAGDAQSRRPLPILAHGGSSSTQCPLPTMAVSPLPHRPWLRPASPATATFPRQPFPTSTCGHPSGGASPSGPGLPTEVSKKLLFFLSFGYYDCMHNFLRIVKLCFVT